MLRTLSSAMILAGALAGSAQAQAPDVGYALPSEPESIPAAFEAVTEKVICSSACQDQARVHRNEIRKVLGTEVTREIIFK
jgi:hypothetical protein